MDCEDKEGDDDEYVYKLVCSTLAKYKESLPFDYVEEMGQLTIGDEEEETD